MKIKLLALILSAVVVVGGGAAVTVVSNRPETVAMNAISGAIEDFCAREDVAPLLSVFKEGSVEFAYEGIELDGEDDEVSITGAAASNILSSAKISGKVYFAENSFMVENLSAEYEDVKLSASFFLSDDAIGISENEILDASVGIVKGDAADDFMDSIFAFGSGSEYELDEETTDMIANALKVYDELDVKGMKKDVQKLYESYVKELYKAIKDHAEFESESDKVKLSTGKTNARVITITIDAEAAANIIADFYEFLCDDDQLVDFLDKYEDAFAPVLEASEYDEDKSIADMYEEALEEYEDYIDELVDMAEDSDDDEELVIEVITSKVGSNLLKLNVKYEKESVFAIDFGKDGAKKSNEITLTVDGEKYAYEISENSSKAYEAEFSVNGEKIFTLEIDKKDDAFELAFADGDVVIKGDMIIKNKSTTIEISKITAYDTTIKTDITLILKQKDKMPKFDDKFDNISDITEADIEGWIEELESIALGDTNAKDDQAPAPEPDDSWTSDY